MKKNKLNLDSFKVQSFVTSLDNRIENTLKGGNPDTIELCSQGPQICEESHGPACDPNTFVVCPSEQGGNCATLPSTGC